MKMLDEKMEKKLTRTDYVSSILNHCRIWTSRVCTLEDTENFRRLIAYDLQKLGEIDREKAELVWSGIETRQSKKHSKKVI